MTPLNGQMYNVPVLLLTFPIALQMDHSMDAADFAHRKQLS